jgi:HlyD family secretion protein
MKLLNKLKSKAVIITIIVIVLVFTAYKIFIGGNGVEYVLEEVKTGNVVKEVSETGMVKISEQVDLSFKYSGRIDEISVRVGNYVEANQSLAKLDMNQSYIELSEAQATLNVAKADYDKLLAGSSFEEIKIAETDVLNAQTSLNNAKQSLENIKIDAKEDLLQAYENAIDYLDSAYLNLYNSFNVVSNIQRTYYTGSDQESIIVKNNRSLIETNLGKAENYLYQAKVGTDSSVDYGLSEFKIILSNTRDSLMLIRNMTETSIYRDVVSSTDKTSLDTQKTNINTSYTNIITAQQGISSTKITNETNINTAEASIATAEVNLQKAQDQLEFKKAGPTQENVDLYKARIQQAEAQVSLSQNRINESSLRSPVNGQIISVNKIKGETVQVNDVVFSILPSGPFQVEVDIYEEDIVDVKVDNYVEISIPAFPNDIFMGKVISVNPAEKIVDGVVYYEVNISFDAGDKGVKPGMTADVVIEVNKKENVLIIPRQALKKVNGDKVVEVFENNEVKEKKIEIGLEGEDNIEIISGLVEGEKVVLGVKK